MALSSTSPSAQGVDAAGITALVDALEALDGVDPHSLVVHRHGARIAEGHWAPHSPERRRLAYSLSKTFTGTALALAMGEGLLGLDDLVADHLPELFVGAAPTTRRVRVRHIASMATGHDREMLVEAMQRDPGNPLRAFFAAPPPHEPGSVFAYNQPPVLALATILQRLTGQRLSEYLRPRLLEPLGVPPILWQQHGGVDIGFSGAHTTLDAVAKLGQLHLDDGAWDGRRLLPEGWVARASSVQTPNPGEPEVDWRQGYGFGMWMARHGYRGDGAFGQFMIVLPEHDAVVAIFSATGRMQAVLDAVWTHLLPAMDGAGTTEADDALAHRLAGLSMPTARERTRGLRLAQRQGRFEPAGGTQDAQPSLRAVVLDGDDVVLEEAAGAVRVPLGDGWALDPQGRNAASSAEVDGATVVDVAFLETPHRLHLTCDPASGTFRAAWQTPPLGGDDLADLHAPA